MIIAKLQGGLGNQMFQYAFGRKIAISNNAELKLDISAFDLDIPGTTPRKYSLGGFNIEEKFASEDEINKLNTTSFWDQFRPLSYRNKIVQTQVGFNPQFLELGDEHYLEGYWQSEKYFEGVEKQIRKDFNLKEDSILSSKIALQIQRSPCPVSLHIRRGDYVTDKRTSEVHGACSPEYYEQAVQIMADKFGQPELFIFSDDIAWAKNNLHFNHPMTFVSQSSPMSDCEELVLLSLCRHHIIANSSFSWWGAWLSDQQDKTIIAPKKWFNDPNLSNNDIVPDSWVKI